MSMYVDTKYDNFMATVTVKSDSIDAIDLYDPGFRIDFTNQFTAASNATKIAELIDARTGYEETAGTAIAAAEAELQALRTKLRYANTTEETTSLNKQCQEKAVELNYLQKDIWMCEHGQYNDCPTCHGTGFVTDIIDESNSDYTAKGSYLYQVGLAAYAQALINDEEYCSDDRFSVFACTEKHTYDDYPIYITKLPINGKSYELRMDPSVVSEHVFYSSQIDDDDLHLVIHNNFAGDEAQAGLYNVRIYCRNDGEETVSICGFDIEPGSDVRITGSTIRLPLKLTKTICTKCKGKCLDTSEQLAKGIEDYLQETNTPMLSIGNDTKSVNTDVYCNADDETLIRNGMQYWINEDKKSMTFRFIPQLHLIDDSSVDPTPTYYIVQRGKDGYDPWTQEPEYAYYMGDDIDHEYTDINNPNVTHFSEIGTEMDNLLSQFYGHYTSYTNVFVDECWTDDTGNVKIWKRWQVSEDDAEYDINQFVEPPEIIDPPPVETSSVNDNASSGSSAISENGLAFQSVVCVVALDYNNVTRFEVSLLPRLISGDIEKNNPKDKDPILGQGTWSTSAYNVSSKEIDIISHPLPDSECVPGYEEIVPASEKIHPERLVGTDVGEIPRTDYEWNSSIDKDHLYVNNTEATPADQKVPLYICKTSAYISPELVDAGYNFDWTKFKSDLYDVAAQSAISIPFTINGKSTTADLAPVTATVKLVETYLGDDEELNELNQITVNLYEIIQNIETSSNSGIVSKNQLRCRVAI